MMRPVFSLDQDLPADRTLASLREHRAHTAVLVDAAGLAVGLITIQDLLGELLGVEPTAPHQTAARTGTGGAA
jgi:CBS domain containing-hemolysin-like protein